MAIFASSNLELPAALSLLQPVPSKEQPSNRIMVLKRPEKLFFFRMLLTTSLAQTRAELDYLLALKHNRTPEDVRSSLYMSTVFLTSSDIGRMIGYWVEPEKLPLTDSLFSNIAQDANYFLWSLKFKYERVRPYILEPKIHDLEESFAASYPGGHVTYAYIYAYIYQELAPEFTDFFITNAYAMAHAREMIGVHYPSDNEAARIFARQFVNMLFRNEKFQQDFRRVKNEWELKRKQDSRP
jgi:acid phosphatase (class A)